MKKLIILFLLLVSSFLYSQVIETNSTKKNFYKDYSSNVKFLKNYQDTKEFIKKIDKNLLSLIKDNKLEKELENFFYNGNYRSIKYLSRYLSLKSSSKTLSLNEKGKLQICNIIKKYNPDSPLGDNCIGDLNFESSKIVFWKYFIPYTKAYIKYVESGKNTNLFFYSALYFLIVFSIIIIILSFLKSSNLFIKDIKSLISLKRENYESLFWAATLFVLFLYLLSFKPLLLLLIIITISFSYLKKRFIPLYIILLLIPLVLNILTEKYDMYEVNLSKVDKLAIEVIQTDILATKSQLNILKDNESFFSNIAIAYNYKKDSKYAASLKYYKKALKIKKMGFIYNNMANIYAITNQKDKAIFNYNEAKYYSDEAIYFYNLSKLYFRDKNKERGEYSLELANNISKKLVNKYHSISTFNHNRFYLDKFPKYKESLAIYKSLKELGEKDTYLSLFTFTQKAYFINLGIAIAFFIFLQLLFRRKLAAGYCQRCSITFNSLDISVKHSSFDLCPQCHSMMSTRSSLKKEDLIKKEKEIRFRKKIINIRDVIVNALVPGSFIYYKNNRYLGVVFILWHSYYLVVVVSFYSKWKLVITENFFNFSTIIFGILELSVYLYTYYKLKTRS